MPAGLEQHLSPSVEGDLRPEAETCACIDIGSNTTRLLVARAVEGRLREVCDQRAFTRLGKEIRRDGEISEAKLAEVAEVVAIQVRIARELGAEPRVVATAAAREADNAEALVEAVRDGAGTAVRVLSADEEAHLAFAGATRTLGHPVEQCVAVADVGGGSSELAVGTATGGAHWTASFAIGSGFLADAYLRSDPPAIRELQAVREHAVGVFGDLEVESVALAVAVGGSASSLRRLVGAVLEPETLERGIRVLARAPIAEVVRRFELEPERVRILPAGILVLEAISLRLGQPLQIGNGGLREGVVLAMLAEQT
jgi:exopolyphosphatase/guanosine-5'-triphosphate,3'-diphosphate pyrophosphatase